MNWINGNNTDILRLFMQMTDLEPYVEAGEGRGRFVEEKVEALFSATELKRRGSECFMSQ